MITKKVVMKVIKSVDCNNLQNIDYRCFYCGHPIHYTINITIGSDKEVKGVTTFINEETLLVNE